MFATPGPYAAMTGGSSPNPTVGVHTFPLRFDLWAGKYASGESLATTDVEQVSARCWPPELKCRSRMHYYLADREARARYPDSRALTLDDDGFVTETTSANLVIYKEKRGLVTPPAEKILPGISLAVLRWNWPRSWHRVERKRTDAAGPRRGRRGVSHQHLSVHVAGHAIQRPADWPRHPWPRLRAATGRVERTGGPGRGGPGRAIRQALMFHVQRVVDRVQVEAEYAEDKKMMMPAISAITATPINAVSVFIANRASLGTGSERFRMDSTSCPLCFADLYGIQKWMGSRTCVGQDLVNLATGTAASIAQHAVDMLCIQSILRCTRSDIFIAGRRSMPEFSVLTVHGPRQAGHGQRFHRRPSRSCISIR